VALVSDAWEEAARGNRTTIHRWLGAFRGNIVPIVAGTVPDMDPLPDLVHGYHALRGGAPARELAARWKRPLVVSLGGTDLAALAFGTEGADRVAEVLRSAACVTGAFPGFASHLPPGTPYRTVPRSVAAPGTPALGRSPDGTVRAVLPAGLRPVKDLLLAVRLTADLLERGTPLTLRILGRAVDEEYAAAVASEVARTQGVTLGTLDPAAMADAYAAADVVWNTSRHEGGANALLEGVAAGNAMFARDVLGNREFFQFGDTPGRLFRGDLDDAAAFHAVIAAETRSERSRRRLQGWQWLRRWCAPASEERALLAAWTQALSRPPA
jgi:hypothetical protein